MREVWVHPRARLNRDGSGGSGDAGADASSAAAVPGVYRRASWKIFREAPEKGGSELDAFDAFGPDVFGRDLSDPELGHAFKELGLAYTFVPPRRFGDPSLYLDFRPTRRWIGRTRASSGSERVRVHVRRRPRRRRGRRLAGPEHGPQRDVPGVRRRELPPKRARRRAGTGARRDAGPRGLRVRRVLRGLLPRRAPAGGAPPARQAGPGRRARVPAVSKPSRRVLARRRRSEESQASAPGDVRPGYFGPPHFDEDGVRRR